jgi:hypothetical protein
MRTLAGSFQLVQAQLGRVFLKDVIEVSAWLQEAARDLREMSPATKESIAAFTKAGLALGGMLAAGAVGGRVLGAFATMVTTTTGQLGILAAGFATAYAALTSFANGLTRQADDAEKANQYAAAYGEHNVDIKKAMRIQDPAERRKFLLEREQHERRVEMELQTRQNALLPKGVIDTAVGAVGARLGFSTDAALAEKLGEQAQTARIRRLMFHQAVEDLDREQLGRPKLERKKAFLDNFLTDFKPQGQPAYSGLDDVRDRIQISALRDDSLQLEMKRIQQESRDELGKIVAGVDKLNLKRGGARP